MVSIVGNTLNQLVTAVAQELGQSQTFTATALSGSANVVSTQMNDAEAPTQKYGGHYLYCTSDTAGALSVLGQQQRVTRGGFAGATGTFTTAANFVTANVQSGSGWLLCGVIPVLDQDALVGIRTCVNRAIRKLWFVDRLDIAATSGVLEYDLASYWWMSQKRVRRLLDPDPGSSGHQAPASQGWRIVQDGELWVLQLSAGYATGQTFTLEVERPLNSRLYLTGAWADQASPTAGLILGADACLGAWANVLACALYECMKVLAVQAGGARKLYWEARVAEQRAVISAIKLYQVDSVEMSLGEGPEEWPGASGVGDRGFWSRGWS